MKYQLVLQFEATDIVDFDDLVALEEMLIAGLSGKSHVDGHDFGQGEFNIFIFTDAPKRTLEEVQKILEDHSLPSRFKAAYREVGSEEYIGLWPSPLKGFTIA